MTGLEKEQKINGLGVQVLDPQVRLILLDMLIIIKCISELVD